MGGGGGGVHKRKKRNYSILQYLDGQEYSCTSFYYKKTVCHISLSHKFVT